MVRRRKKEEIVGVVHFEAKRSEDPDVIAWLAEHKAQNGDKIRVSKRGKGVRVGFSKEADMAAWKARAERAAKGTKPPAGALPTA